MSITKRFLFILLTVVILNLLTGFSGCTVQSKDGVEPNSLTYEFSVEDRETLVEIENFIKRKKFDPALEKIEKLLSKNRTLPKLYLFKARILHGKGKTQEALDLITSQINNNPSNVGLVAVRGQFLLELDHLESARLDFLEAYQRNFRTIDILKILADIEQKNGNLAKSLSYIKEVMKLEPNDHQLWFQSAQLEIRLRRISEAKLAITKAIDLAEDNIKYHQFYVEILAIQKQKKTITQHIQKLFKKFPHDSWVSMQMAVLLVEEKEFGKAIEVLQAALKAKPKNHLLMFQIATILAARKKWEASIVYFKAGLKQKPNSTWAKIQLAKILLQTGQTTTAINYLNQVRKEKTRNLFVYQTLAKIYNRQNDTFEAERIIVEGLSLDDKNLPLILEYADILEKRGKYKEAIKAFEEAFLSTPENHVIVGKLGNLYRLTKDNKKASEYFKQAISLKPTDSWIRAYYIELLTDMEKWQEALQEIQQMLAIVPDDYWAYAKKALIEHKLENHAKAYQSISKAIVLRSDALWLKEIAAQILESMGEYKKAEAAFLEALKQTPNSSYLLTRLGYVQIFLDKEKSLHTITEALDSEDFDLNTIELYLYLKGQTDTIWGFKPDSLEHKSYESIIHKQFTTAETYFLKLKQQSSPHLPFLKFFLEFLKKERRGKIEISTLQIQSLKSQWHFFYLGLQAQRLNKNKKAKEYYEQALTLGSNNHWIMVKLAFTYQQLKEHQKAIALLNKYLDKRPESDNTWVLQRLALNYDLTEQYSEAEEVYMTVLNKNPNDNMALNNLAWMYLNAKNPSMHKVDEALKLALKAVKISPTAANLDTLAEAYFQKKEYQRALKVIERALDRDRQSLDDFKKTKKKIFKAMQSNPK